MPSHEEEIKRFYKNPREEPDKEFADSFKLFALWDDLEEAINNPNSTKSEVESLRKQYIESLKNDNKSLDKLRLEAKSRFPLASEESEKKVGGKVGRPTLVSDILGAYRALKDGGDVDFNAPKTTLYKAIRERVFNSRNDIAIDVKGNPQGLGDEVIRRGVTPNWEADLEKIRQQSPDKPSLGPSKL